MPYLALGYPSLPTSLDLAEAAVENGADLLELGVPFSDPLADGPVIQRATQAALSQGVTLTTCLESVRQLRQRGMRTPLLLMGYYNPILAYGLTRFGRDCGEVGVDGLIVPDLPPEEGAALRSACGSAGVGITYLLAPTSTQERIGLVTASSQGFVYLVSVTGVTGARDRLSPGLRDFVMRVRSVTAKPLAVGFGISSPSQAREVAAVANGVIVGSAIVRLAGGADPRTRVGEFVHDLRQAMVRD
jgi:tryptophan synthase alpha chain